MTCREGGVPILSHGVELPRPTLLPPDVDASDGQHRDDEAERTDDNAVGHAEHARHMQSIKPTLDRIADVFAGRLRQFDQSAAVAVKCDIGATTFRRTLENVAAAANFVNVEIGRRKIS